MANKQHAQFSDENGNIYYLENQTEDVLDPSGKPLSDGGDLSEASVTFTADSTRTLPKSGSRFKAFCGSVLKFLSDLKAVSFSGSYNDLSNKPSIPSGAAASQAVANNCTTTAAGSVLDARQGKVLMDKANQLSSELSSLKTSFQDGIKKIAGKLTSLGVSTSNTASPDTISNNIQTLYNNRYNEGYNAGKAAAKPTCSLVHSQAGSGTKDYTYTAPSAGTCLVTLSGVNAGTRYCQKNGSNQSPARQYDTSGRMLFEYIVPVNAGDRVRAYIQITEDGNWNSGSASMYFVK